MSSGIHYCSLKGGRKDNEDAHSIARNINGKNKDMAPINFYGLYDGHGGKDVSNFLKKSMKLVMMRPEINYPLQSEDKKIVKILYDVAEEILIKNHEDDAREVGSTCLISCHSKKDGNDYLDVMNTGDSRLVVCEKDFKARSVTVDHKPDSPLEKKRILEMGANPERDIWNDGGVYRIGELSVSRAFGDSKNKYVISEPEIYSEKITDKDEDGNITNMIKFMIMGCDGLWDVVSDQDAVDFVVNKCYDKDMNKMCDKDMMHMYSSSEDNPNETYVIARELGEYAIEKGSGDNITIIIVFFD